MRETNKTAPGTEAKRRSVLGAAVSQVQEFIGLEISEGLLLLTATVIALVWANSPWPESYNTLWHTDISLAFGKSVVSRTLVHWVNDGFMVLFFLVVGLEIKREILVGELSSRKKASLPVVAALGGMIVPAAIYFFLNRNTDGVHGWGIPMATDIAFSLGVLALLGKRVPVQLKVFLMAFAIADDIGAVIIIAIFYASGIVWSHLLIAVVVVLLLLGANAAGVRSTAIYTFLGVLLWIATLDSGIHATVAGVVLAMTIPTRSRLDRRGFLERLRLIVGRLDGGGEGEHNVLHEEDRQQSLHALKRVVEDCEAPNQRMAHALHPWISFVIVPLFALSNAGVKFEAGLGTLIQSAVPLGVFLGLVIGKQVGIVLFSYLAVRSGIASLPSGVTWRQVYGLGWIGGIGFTMSLFITGLAFGNSSLADLSKTAIYIASVVAGVGGLWILGRKNTGATKRSW